MAISDFVADLVNRTLASQAGGKSNPEEMQGIADNASGTIRNMFSDSNKPQYQWIGPHQYNAAFGKNGYAAIPETSSSDAQNTEQPAPVYTGAQTLIEMNDNYNKRMADENADWVSHTWFENQTGAGRGYDEDKQYIWDMLTSDEFGGLSDEFKDQVLYDWDTYSDWYDAEKAANTYENMYGAGATVNPWDIVDASNMDELINYYIDNNQAIPVDLGVADINDLDRVRRAMAISNIAQGAKYAGKIDQDSLNAQLAIIDPSLIGSYSAFSDTQDNQAAYNDARRDAYMAAMAGITPKEAAVVSGSNGQYVYDPDADYSNLSLSLTAPQDIVKLHDAVQEARSNPDYDYAYSMYSGYFDTIDDIYNAYASGLIGDYTEEQQRMLNQAINDIAYRNNRYWSA